MRRAPRVEKICTVCNEIGDIGDSMKGSSSPMKNKVGAQKGALIKMKQENMYIYQWLFRLCYVPIIAPSFIIKSSGYCCIVLLFLTRMCIFARCACGKIVACSEIVCGSMQVYANSICYLVVPVGLAFWAVLLL